MWTQSFWIVFLMLWSLALKNNENDYKDFCSSKSYDNQRATHCKIMMSEILRQFAPFPFLLCALVWFGAMLSFIAMTLFSIRKSPSHIVLLQLSYDSPSPPWRCGSEYGVAIFRFLERVNGSTSFRPLQVRLFGNSLWGRDSTRKWLLCSFLMVLFEARMCCT